MVMYHEAPVNLNNHPHFLQDDLSSTWSSKSFNTAHIATPMESIYLAVGHSLVLLLFMWPFKTGKLIQEKAINMGFKLSN